MSKERHWHVADKWKRHLTLIGSRRLSRHIPATRLLSKRNMRVFLRRYPVVFVKPVTGSFGNHIIRVSRRNKGYAVHRENRVKHVTKSRIVRTVYKHVGRRRFLLQKGVSILKVRGAPVDFRVLMLRPRKKWEFMGIMGKRATGNRIVTNHNHGGRAMRFKDVLRKAGYTRREIKRMKKRMVSISRAAALKFARRYKNCRRMGVDIAVDKRQRIWILEVNTNPFFRLFRRHENKRLYRRIRRKMRIIRRKQS